MFFISFLTWKYVETPFRNKAKVSAKQVFIFSGCTIFIFVVVGLLGHFNEGFEQRFDGQNFNDSMTFSPLRGDCHTSGENYLKPRQACHYFEDEVTWAVLGDSHGVELAYSLAENLEQQNTGLAQLTFNSCMPVLAHEVEDHGCHDWLNEALIYLEETDNINNILVAFRHSFYLFGDQLDFYPEIPNKDFGDIFTDKTIENPREAYWDEFQDILARLVDIGKTVYVLYPVPDLPVHIRQVVAPISIFTERPLLDGLQTIPAEYYFKRNEFILNKLESLNYSENLISIKPFEIFCDKDYCPAVLDDKALYFDDDHVSLHGSQLIIDNLIGHTY